MIAGAVILAAGESRRLGRPKQLLPYRGGTLIGATVQIALCVTPHVAVIVGAYRTQVVAALDGFPVSIVDNVAWTEGMASSMRLGVAWAASHAIDTLLLLVCDQPRLCAKHLKRLLTTHETSGGVVASGYEGTVGVPVVIGRDRFSHLAALTGDHGARSLVRTATDLTVIDWPPGADDVDTPSAIALLTPLSPPG